MKEEKNFEVQEVQNKVLVMYPFLPVFSLPEIYLHKLETLIVMIFCSIKPLLIGREKSLQERVCVQAQTSHLFLGAVVGMGRVGVEVGDNDRGRFLLHYVHFISGRSSRNPLTSSFQYKSQDPAHAGAGLGISRKMRTILFLHSLKISTGTARFRFRS